MKKILLIEDDLTWLQKWQDDLRDESGEYQICTATTPTEALGAFRLRHDWNAIIDGCIGGDDFNALPVIEEIRKAFGGVMIAASMNPDLRSNMMQNGCTGQAEKKYAVRQMLFMLRRQAVIAC